MKCLVKEQTRVSDKKRGEKFVFVDQVSMMLMLAVEL